MDLGAGSVTALYYSVVTLTTLGYGDVTPVTTAARMTAALEAMVGQVYLVVLVARLVGLNVSQTTPQDRN
jgi:voltage-gated potassium channel Kch